MGDQLAVPGQDGVRPGDIRHLGESLAAQAMTDLAERGSLRVREFQPPFRLRLEDTIFGGQIFVPRQQLLVHHASDVSQDAHPIHMPSALANSRLNCSKTPVGDATPGLYNSQSFLQFLIF